MNDREFLKLAAKAAGIQLVWHNFSNIPSLFKGLSSDEVWNPLTDDGDALRLAVKLGLTITPNYHVEQKGLGVVVFTELEDSEDFCMPTRRAIVRAAAEIGRKMP